MPCLVLGSWFGVSAMSKAESLRRIYERVENCKRTIFLDELVDLQRVQAVSQVNQKNFSVTLVSGVVVRGEASQYDAFMDKYLIWLEMR